MDEGRSVRRALVTGASGFIGRALCEELVDLDIQVVAAARKGVSSCPACQWTYFELPGHVPAAALAGVDTVFHLAARAHSVADSPEDAALYDIVNRQGTRDLARAAREAGVNRFVLMSSVKAMRAPGDSMVRENDDALPNDLYGLSKRFAEYEAFKAANGEMDVVILRPALVYGAGVKGNLALLIEALSSGRTLPLPCVENRRSLIGLGDLLKCTLLAARLKAAKGRTYVVTDGQVYSTERIINALAATVGATHTPRVRFPLTVLRLAAMMGDKVSRVPGLHPPLDTPKLQRLISNAEYESSLVEEDLGFVPSETLENSSIGA